ncbi:membrane-bound transcription factor site-2 protease-like [Stegodyphus dumicola]|uniref:membrane-bound transcription factor site-2 protease-like n=1 Tax=Stegodyphus dumicola TaxID=202533 RepID=UPI0015B014F3|nr:membrane-bound transcription factor site-2 protease-like [Stegodyphus dumicola]
MAYIAVDNEQLLQLSYWQQIRIYSAGIWHNIVLSIFAILLLVSNTILLAPVFQKGNGLTVLHVEQHSSASQPAGFSKGDQILSINNCILYDAESWSKCLQILNYSPQQGFCALDDFILQENSALEGSKSLNCCGSDSRRLCFQYLNSKKNATVCLPARKLVERSSSCNRDPLICKNNFSCLVPVLLNASQRFVEIKRRNKYSVLYIGSLEELTLVVTVSSWTSNFRFFSVTFVEIYETLLMYILAFSSGLAIINTVPCYGLDGEYIFESLVHLTLSKHIPRGSDRNLIVKYIKIFGVILLFITIIHTILNITSNFHFSSL